MPDKIDKKEFIERLSKRMSADKIIAENWINAITETIYEAFKEGKGVTLKGFDSFFIKPKKDSWIFKFNPSQKLRALFKWSSTYKGES